MRQLTQKQQQFCNNVVAGMTGKDAYIKAYNSKANDTTAYKEASLLLTREDIQTRIRELSKPLQVKAVATALSDRERIKSMLWQFIEDETLSPETRMKASDQLNRMNAEYINTNVNVEQVNNMTQLDTDTLKRLTS